MDCGISLYDIRKPGFIGTTSNDYYVISPFQGSYDNTNTNGVKITQKVRDSPQSFLICFATPPVGATQSNGVIGLRDSNGNGEQCSAHIQCLIFVGTLDLILLFGIYVLFVFTKVSNQKSTTKNQNI